jgi:hypothetical protein|tara:strand:+ start:2088 stop:2315 length:228 start_codon:yes stop_codon:yes gene_type:complete
VWNILEVGVQQPGICVEGSLDHGGGELEAQLLADLLGGGRLWRGRGKVEREEHLRKLSYQVLAQSAERRQRENWV